MPPEKKPRGRLRQSAVFFPHAGHAKYCCPSCCPTKYPVLIQIFSIVISDKVWRTSTLFAPPLWFLRNIALPIANQKSAWTCDRMRRQPATAITLDSFGLLYLPFQFCRKLKISHWRKNIRIREKRVYTAKLLGFKVPNLNSGFKISRIMTKPGCFHFGFVLLRVNGKTNPVLKRSRFVTNQEQFPLEDHNYSSVIQTSRQIRINKW